MGEWTLSLIVSLGIGTHVTNKLIPGNPHVHFAGQGPVMWMISKPEGLSYQVIYRCKNLPDSTYGMHEKLKCMQNKNVLTVWTIFHSVLKTYVFVYFVTKQDILFIEVVYVTKPYCLSSLLATANQMRRFGEAPHGSRVCRRKSRVYEQYIPYEAKENTILMKTYTLFWQILIFDKKKQRPACLLKTGQFVSQNIC